MYKPLEVMSKVRKAIKNDYLSVREISENYQIRKGSVIAAIKRLKKNNEVEFFSELDPATGKDVCKYCAYIPMGRVIRFDTMKEKVDEQTRLITKERQTGHNWVSGTTLNGF